MLVLSRQRDEKIVVPLSMDTLKKLVSRGEDTEIVITVVDIRGDKARLGLQADRAIPTHRFEVWQAIQREQQTQA